MEGGLDIHLPAWLAIIAIVLLMGLSAFFAMGETALTSSSRPRIHALARKGNARAQLVDALRERQDEVLSAMLLGNNLVNVVASALATGALIALFGQAGVAYAAVIMTVLIVIFAEVFPKTLALNRADRVILAMAPAVRIAALTLMPVNRTVQWIVRQALALSGVRGREAGPEVSEEELRGAIELHGELGEATTERAMLRSILDLAEVQVGQIMVHRRLVYSVNADQRPNALIEQVLAGPHTRVPLWRGQPENIIGVLHVRDLLQALRTHRANPDEINILEIAQRPWFVPESTTLIDQLSAFRRRHEHFAMVVDEYGAFMGVVTLNDILEEIVGDIGERPRFLVPGCRREPDGSYIVDGHVAIRDLNREYEWHLPDEAASTIAGLILAEARRIPDVGQKFTFHGFRFEILRRKRNQIASVRIIPPPSERPPEARVA
jgi:Mg2+/Co2+ transporter CorB